MFCIRGHRYQGTHHEDGTETASCLSCGGSIDSAQDPCPNTRTDLFITHPRGFEAPKFVHKDVAEGGVT